MYPSSVLQAGGGVFIEPAGWKKAQKEAIDAMDRSDFPEELVAGMTDDEFRVLKSRVIRNDDRDPELTRMLLREGKDSLEGLVNESKNVGADGKTGGATAREQAAAKYDLSQEAEHALWSMLGDSDDGSGSEGGDEEEEVVGSRPVRRIIQLQTARGIIEVEEVSSMRTQTMQHEVGKWDDSYQRPTRQGPAHLSENDAALIDMLIARANTTASNEVEEEMPEEDMVLKNVQRMIMLQQEGADPVGAGAGIVDIVDPSTKTERLLELGRLEAALDRYADDRIGYASTDSEDGHEDRVDEQGQYILERTAAGAERSVQDKLHPLKEDTFKAFSGEKLMPGERADTSGERGASGSAGEGKEMVFDPLVPLGQPKELLDGPNGLMRGTFESSEERRSVQLRSRKAWNREVVGMSNEEVMKSGADYITLLSGKERDLVSDKMRADAESNMYGTGTVIEDSMTVAELLGKRRDRDVFDVESMLSTRSNLYHHPESVNVHQLTRDRKKKSASRHGVGQRHGSARSTEDVAREEASLEKSVPSEKYDAVVEDGNEEKNASDKPVAISSGMSPSRVTLSQVHGVPISALDEMRPQRAKGLQGDAGECEEKQGDSDSEEEEEVVVNRGVARGRDETREEKRARKAAAKSFKAVREGDYRV